LNKVNKKIGLGSLSLLLCIIGILFAFSFGDKGAFGDVIIKFIGQKAWSNGDRGIHYTIYYTLIFFIPSVILGLKFKNDSGAKLGKIISLILLIIIVLVIIFSTVTATGGSQISLSVH
jgi:branched-subunit amino acid permease